MTTLTYTRFELLRTFRNRRFFAFSLIFPIVIFLFVAGTNRHAKIGDISFPLYYMTGMMAWGSMAAILAGGARIALERSIGWTRQIRITPMSVGGYFGTKVVCAYAMALCSIILLSVAGMAVGVHLSGGQWGKVALLVLIGLIPFAVMGIILGHLLTPDSMGPAMGGVTMLFALLGGSWFSLGSSGVLHDIGTVLPSYWLVQAGGTARGGSFWPAEAWIVIGVWTVALAVLARWVYLRDTAR